MVTAFMFIISAILTNVIHSKFTNMENDVFAVTYLHSSELETQIVRIYEVATITGHPVEYLFTIIHRAVYEWSQHSKTVCWHIKPNSEDVS